MLTWQGLGDVVNKFRRKVLRLEPIDPSWAPGMIARLQIPHTYCWYVAVYRDLGLTELIERVNIGRRY